MTYDEALKNIDFSSITANVNFEKLGAALAKIGEGIAEAVAAIAEALTTMLPGLIDIIEEVKELCSKAVEHERQQLRPPKRIDAKFAYIPDKRAHIKQLKARWTK